MSNSRLNIRILMWHLQCTYNWKWSWTYNDYHKKLNHGWFAIYEYKNFFKSIDQFDHDKVNS
ncbi:MAG: hypothetical protein ACWA5P_01710 [bacterium]